MIEIHRVFVKSIQFSFNPFEVDVWGVGRILSKRSVFAALWRNHLESTPYTKSANTCQRAIWNLYGTRRHAERVAHLVTHGWSDPISVDVGVPEMTGFQEAILLDGHHRLAAAIYRKDKTIDVAFSGSVRHVESYYDIESKYQQRIDILV